MIRLTRRLVLTSILIFACTVHAPAQSGVTAVLPNGREIHPAGNWIPLAPYPFALAITPGGNEVAIPSIGFPFALNLIENPGSPSPVVQRLPATDLPAPRKKDSDEVEAHAALAYSPDGSTLWVATGDSGKIRAYKTRAADGSPQLTAEFDIPLDGPTAGENYSESFAATVLSSRDGRALYALDQGNWRIVIIDVATRQRVASISTGRYPMNLAL